MAELTASDVAIYTGGRLPDNATTQRILDAALAAVRNYCEWHVCPVHTGEVVDMDGPGGPVLTLPTLRLSAVTALIEDDAAVDVTTLRWSADGTVRKKSGAHWSRNYGAITATITHGWSESEAPEWRRAVLKATDLMSLTPVVAGVRDVPNLLRKKVDDVEYYWPPPPDGPPEMSAVLDTAVFDRYRRFFAP